MPGEPAPPTTDPVVGAVVLTGGGGVRLGGVDKASIELGGRTLLEHALQALGDVGEVVVVGTDVPTSRPVTFTLEDPAGGGPAAGVLAGLGRFARRPEQVVVLAVDMPAVTAATVRRLLGAARTGPGNDAVDGAVLVDAAGRLQYLCAVYSVPALDRARSSSGDGAGHGLAMGRLVAGLALVRVPALGSEARDLDTWEDLADLREAFGT
jgi:molybdopterin-guanine dinucleotide biosynthesis protein A